MSALRCNKCHTQWQEDNPPYWCPKCEEKERLAKYQQPPKPAESQAAEGFAAGEDGLTSEQLSTVRTIKSYLRDQPSPDGVISAARYLAKRDRQQLAAAQARIASLEHMQEISSSQIRAGAERFRFADNQRDELKSRVAVLEKALEGAGLDLDMARVSLEVMASICAVVDRPLPMKVELDCGYEEADAAIDRIQDAEKRVNAALAAQSASGSQPSRTEEKK